MPIYEYHCLKCSREFQFLYIRNDDLSPVCPKCGGKDLKKLISRTSYHQSEKDRLASFRPGSMKDDSFYKDSRNIGLSAKKRAKDLGIDLGSGFENKLEKLRSDPSSVFDES